MEGQLENNKVTIQSLKEAVEDGLEEYYKRHKQLTDYIVTAQEVIETSKQELKELDRKYKKELTIRGKSLTKLELIFNFIKNNPGHEQRPLIGLVIEQVLVTNTISTISSMIDNLILGKYIERKRDGKLYTIVEFYESRHYSYGSIAQEIRRIFRELKTVKVKELLDILTLKYPRVHRTTVNNNIVYLMSRNKITSNKTYKYQKGVTYTWIGDNDV